MERLLIKVRVFLKQNLFCIFAFQISSEKTTKDHALFTYQITFIEATSESALQFCLSMLIFREFGFKSWIQIGSLCSSALRNQSFTS